MSPDTTPTRPSTPVLIYDGDCLFCIDQATRLARWVGGKVKLESFREPGVIERYPGLELSECEQRLHLVETDGRISRGFEAVSRTLAIRPILSPLGWIYRIAPLNRLLEWGYMLVARNRFLLGGRRCEEDACAHHLGDAASPSRAAIRDLFIRLVGVVFLIAFLSLLSQLMLLYGSRGLLPVGEYMQIVKARVGFFGAPTVFWLDASDGALKAAGWLGVLFSLTLIANIAPRLCLALLWAIYLSFATVGRDFLSFQWDNLLLETALFAFLAAPSGLRPRRAPPPHPLAVFLLLWLVFRVHFESGAAKLLTGDPTWRDLTAMATYYETAPLPTWLGWYAHQLPLWAHKLSSLLTLLLELIAPLFIWVRSRRVRGVVFLVMVLLQLPIMLTANYGFFNILTLVICLFVLDDGHLQWLQRRRGGGAGATHSAPAGSGRTLRLAALAIVLVPLSIVPFLRFFDSVPGLYDATRPVQRVLSNWRSLNAYHLFASMTIVRREALIEGSNDGETWSSYEFRYKPGDLDRAPRFVAPHQPRVDFQLWFLLLRGRPTAAYFDTLLARMLEEPASVASLFSRNPFPEDPPRMLRVAIYRYRFTDTETRRRSGNWWRRELEGYSKPVSGRSAPRAGA